MRERERFTLSRMYGSKKRGVLFAPLPTSRMRHIAGFPVTIIALGLHSIFSISMRRRGSIRRYLDVAD
jgi:hypothetical protein